MIDVFTVRGTGEIWNSPTNMLANVTKRLDPTRFRTRDIQYPASVGPANPERNALGPSLALSRRIGKIELAQRIQMTPNLVGLLGYSLGAYVVSDFLEDLAAGASYTKGCRVLFAAMIANPRRRRGDSFDGKYLPGFGIAGEHGTWPRLRTFEVANQHDGIPCCPDGSPLRNLTDGADEFSFAVAGGWTADLADRIRRNRWQPTNVDWIRNPIGTWQAYDLAGRLIRGYAIDGQHTTAYVRSGLTQRLADAINWEVR
ncbi:PE-PPE domain-containing protein [Antrihabitans sp. YC3-6]|uniref:PE-PPE domain-containing protein n=1 Tax=Antrihabitans stalagmiti TaxID=2799499 RepID=A0A934NWX0_9NOCA|nr:PE-PPE domain-containing protein [Antrihabitans stalagmiti]MBJ8342805.1 PE-PPE domain-containing protein [Antrihabitans stalagmiti]